MSEAQRPESLTSTVWRDEAFFQRFALNVHTVLDYFSASPFYAVGCNNDKCKQQGLPLSALSNMEPGVEFVVSFAAEPVLYVIKRQFREDAATATQQAFYYVLHGSVYQAPALDACLRARTRRCLHHLNTAFTQLKRDLEPLSWQEERRKKLKRSATEAPVDTGAAIEAACERADAGGAAKSRIDLETGAGGDKAVGTAAGGEEVAAAHAAVQQAAITPERWARIRQGDNIIMNVLARHSVPIAVPGEPANEKKPS